MLTPGQVYACETALLSKFPAEVSAPLQVMKIGELRIEAIPAETFVQIGLELKSRHSSMLSVSWRTPITATCRRPSIIG